jgi:hypothetical protein
MPVVLFPAVRVVLPGGVTTSPLPGALKVTSIVFEPVRAGDALTVMVAAVPGPVCILQVTGPDTVAVIKLVACRAPAPAVNASSARSALGPRIFGTDKSMEDLPS